MRVSICTSVKDQPEYLKRMIESVLEQTEQDWELIVVDDGSETPAVVPDDPRIKLVRWDENRGIPHGLNHAFELAQGTYVQPLSADEWLDKGKLEVFSRADGAAPLMGTVQHACAQPVEASLGAHPDDTGQYPDRRRRHADAHLDHERAGWL
jgi:glycosyltransferase involved in cell wall biosynthesis